MEIIKFFARIYKRCSALIYCRNGSRENGGLLFGNVNKRIKLLYDDEYGVN